MPGSIIASNHNMTGNNRFMPSGVGTPSPLVKQRWSRNRQARPRATN
jgi:hypothetical protein